MVILKKSIYTNSLNMLTLIKKKYTCTLNNVKLKTITILYNNKSYNITIVPLHAAFVLININTI